MLLLDSTPNITPITDLITTWIHIGQALVGSVGALAFVFAFIWKITAVESKSALAAKQWIQRIVVGTIGVEVASSLVSILTNSVPGSTTH
jgi:uncharacterized membrane protein